MDSKISDLTGEQYMSFRGVDMSLEVKPTVKDYLVGVPSSPIQRWDWRDHGKVAKVRHQGNYTTCWAFTAVACLETAYSLNSPGGRLKEFSEQQLVDCVGNGGIKLGHYTRAWSHIIDRDRGIISRSDYPYLGDRRVCRSSSFPKIVGPRNYIEISHNDNAIMAAVRDYGQVAVCIDYTSKEFQNYMGGIFDVKACENKEIKDLTHAVTIVGYGSDEKDYWIIRNSWGEEWGEEGYMRMVRGKNMCGINLNPYVVYF